jgi:type II secretory pathway pseudopilin PulG
MRRQRGFSLVEYTVVGLAIVAALLLPYINGQSVVVILVDAVKEMFANFSFGISLSRIPSP